jgi:LPS O-antigen subunit length determinant protein (WzzB/FepE family)
MLNNVQTPQDPQIFPKKSPLQQSPEFITLFAIIAHILQHKFTFSLIILCCIGLGATYLVLTPKQYSADFVISPLQQEMTTGLSRFGQSINLNLSQNALGGNSVIFDKFINRFSSATVAEALMRDSKIVHTIFASEWNKEKNKWQMPDNILYFIKSTFSNWLGFGGYIPPNAARLAEYVQKNVHLTDIKKTKMLRVSIQHEDKIFAQYFLEKLYKTTDNQLRDLRIKEIKKSIDYIEKRINTTQFVARRRNLNALIVSYDDEIIMLENEQPFAAEVVRPVTVSYGYVSPRPLKTLLIATLLGFFISTGFLTINYIHKHMKFS